MRPTTLPPTRTRRARRTLPIAVCAALALATAACSSDDEGSTAPSTTAPSSSTTTTTTSATTSASSSTTPAPASPGAADPSAEPGVDTHTHDSDTADCQPPGPGGHP
ncbi:hypothetical protein, partial [Corynebacterium bovis]|uniref:hypothetical protein n=1 Tax=Corynebacterium bovis TaxID=36808 RepID=UPI00163ACB32